MCYGRESILGSYAAPRHSTQPLGNAEPILSQNVGTPVLGF